MSGKIFLDTNILVYINLDDRRHIDKREKVIALLDSLETAEIVISVQVMNELYNVLAKHGIDDDKIQKKLKDLLVSVSVKALTEETLKICWKIRKRYKYSYYDSLIIASALDNKCTVIYTEDMQNGQKIEKSLVIRNPFFD
jgi:predicted nucleic acid-binding protein